MFTGIIREVGVVRRVERTGGGARLGVAAPKSRAALVLGGSIAVDGVCLTVTALEGDVFSADAVPETLERTRLGAAAPGTRVNLELPLRVGDLLDGHLVQGHVDGIGTVVRVTDRGTQREVTVRVDPTLAPYLAEKGSVAVNGVSLTVTGVGEDTFAVALIPTTLTETNLEDVAAGAVVNVEVDVLARYVARLARARGGPAGPAPGLTRESLEEMGY